MQIRNYNPDTDYPGIESLLNNTDTYGGQFDAARDTKERIDTLEAQKPGSVLVVEVDGEIVATVTLFEDGRSAWLYRFAVQAAHEAEAVPLLNQKALDIMKERGHTQVLVYAPQGNQHFEERYTTNGFTKGGDFTCYWQDIV